MQPWIRGSTQATSLPKAPRRSTFPLLGTIPQISRGARMRRSGLGQRRNDLVRDEAVADARNRVDGVRLFGVALDLFAQAVDMGIDGARLDLDFVAPDLSQQFAAAHDLTGLRGQQRQEVELGQRQGDFLALAPYLATVHVDDEAGELEARLGLCLRDRLLAPTQMRAHPG